MNIYREAVAAQKTITAQQLAKDSGYRSYSTFSIAFKQRMGQTVKDWMREMAKTS
jgi:AraC-like DNA-binding protein